MPTPSLRYWIASSPVEVRINIKELASDPLTVLGQSNQELLEQRQDAITKNLRRGYKTINKTFRQTQAVIADDINNRIKLLQAYRYYQQQTKLQSKF